MRILLAPMEGVIDYQMRRVLRGIGGIDLSVTEFIRVTTELLPKKVFHRYCPELTSKPAETRQTRIQLLGSEPAVLAANAKRAVELGSPGIDLNFGCPAKTVNRHRGGACLLDETERIYRIVAQVRAAVPKAIPVTAKIRLGYEKRDSYLDNAQAIEAAGASELVVHARSKRDAYQPPAYWNCIREIKDKVRIPLIANGDIWSVEDYKRCSEESHCTDVMLGRGILSRPDLALAIRAMREGKEHSHLSWKTLCTLLADFFLHTSEHYPEKYMGNRLKQWLHYLKRHFPQAEKLFIKIKKSRDKQFILNCIYGSTKL